MHHFDVVAKVIRNNQKSTPMLQRLTWPMVLQLFRVEEAVPLSLGRTMSQTDVTLGNIIFDIGCHHGPKEGF